MSEIPLIQVLPMPSKHIEPSKVSGMKSGLLAWGNRSTAIKYGNKFDVLVICADDFDFTHRSFVENVLDKRANGSKTKVYFLPVSEVTDGPLSTANYLTQNIHTLELAKNNKIVRRKVSPPKQSNEVIYNSLFKKQKVLVVCLAGKNRSTSTIIRFLMLNSLKKDREDEPTILKKYRKRSWRYNDWVEYFSKLRTFEIFPINDIQLTILDNEIMSLR
jgi:hypothetical protein